MSARDTPQIWIGLIPGIVGTCSSMDANLNVRGLISKDFKIVQNDTQFTSIHKTFVIEMQFQLLRRLVRGRKGPDRPNAENDLGPHPNFESK